MATTWTSGNLNIQPGATQAWNTPGPIPADVAGVTVTLNLAQADIADPATSLSLSFLFGPAATGPWKQDVGFTFVGQAGYVVPADNPSFGEDVTAFVGQWGRAEVTNRGTKRVTLTVTLTAT
jgi:hypothetical protein